MAAVCALLGLSVLGALGARADESVSSLLQTSAVVGESERETYAGERAMTLSESDFEDAAKRSFIEGKLRTLRRELKVEDELRHTRPAPPYILPTNATDRLSGRDSAAVLSILSQLQSKQKGGSVKFDVAQVQKVLSKLTAQLHGPARLGHLVSPSDGWCYQGPVPFVNRMVHIMQIAPIFMNSTRGARVQEGPCPSDDYGPPLHEPMLESCFPLADLRYPKDVWDGEDEHVLQHLLHYVTPGASYAHSVPESERGLAFGVAIMLSCLSSDMVYTPVPTV